MKAFFGKELFEGISLVLVSLPRIRRRQLEGLLQLPAILSQKSA